MSAQARIEQPLRTTTPGGLPGPERPAARTPLSVVPAPIPRSGPGVTLLCVALLLGALAAVLIMNITVSNRQYDLLHLRQEQQSLTEANQRLSEQVGHLEAPQNLAARAGALGMVTPAGTASVDLTTGEFSAPTGTAAQVPLSASYVAPPAPEAPARRAAPSADAQGSIEGPRTSSVAPAEAAPSTQPSPAPVAQPSAAPAQPSAVSAQPSAAPAQPAVQPVVTAPAAPSAPATH